jgi:hypothetical protein
MILHPPVPEADLHPPVPEADLHPPVPEAVHPLVLGFLVLEILWGFPVQVAWLVFVDGQHSTTGLQIRERLSKRNDIEIIDIPEARRKDPEARDVLILNGREDHLIPIRAHQMQMRVLTNTKSLEGRVFTENEQAQNHCQVGNTKLALDVMLKWLNTKTNNPNL